MLKKICLFTPSLEMGGTERVVSILANQFCKEENIEVHVILCTSEPIFYSLDERVHVHVPQFNYKQLKRASFTLQLMRFLRRRVNKIKPNSFLSFGGRYNAFSILALAGAKIPVFITDRSRPGISYGRFFDWLNPIIYRFSEGILAQTSQAVDYSFKETKHKNILRIGNPIGSYKSLETKRESVILNVGRFIKSKNQSQLIDIFAELLPTHWQLWFIGDGPTFEVCKKKVQDLGLEDNVVFLGKQVNLENWYNKSAIFAFTSESEGFPNALGEAMASGCACVSYDCTAGPSDLIDDGKNGFLVPLHDKDFFKNRLNQMMQPEFNRNKMGLAAIESTMQYSEEVIARKTLNFILNNGN